MNPRVWKFESELKVGKLLMLVDVPKEREEEIIRLIRLHHPEASIDGFAVSKTKRDKRFSSRNDLE